MEKNYDLYNIEAFLEDPAFTRWVKNKQAEDDAFWQRWLNTNPGNIHSFREAELQLSLIYSAKRIVAKPGEAENLWMRIESSIWGEAEFNKQRRILVRNRIMAAAMIFALVVAGYMYI